MSTESKPQHVRIFLASPGDVQAEREAIRQCLRELPRSPLLAGRVSFEEVSWDDPYAPAPFSYGETPQASVVKYKHRPSQCDLVVAVLKHRLGSPLPLTWDTKPDGKPYGSGTEWEIAEAESAVGKRPEVWVFYCEEDYAEPRGLSAEQKRERRAQKDRVDAFIDARRTPEGVFRRGAMGYASSAEFPGFFKSVLQTWLRQRLDEAPPSPGEAPSAAPLPEAHRRLLELLRGEAAPDGRLLREVRDHPPRSIAEYRYRRLTYWTASQHAVDRRFVTMTLLLDQGELAEGERFRPEEGTFDDPRTLLAARDEPAFVLLGPPGCGKSTLLRRLEYDLAREALLSGDASTPLTWLVPLNAYRGADGGLPLPPQAWLAQRWAQQHPALAPLAEVMAGHRLYLLLDALNEMPRPHYAALVERWAVWLAELDERGGGHRAVFTCRSLDYSAPLSSDACRVPQAQFQALGDGRIQELLQKYLPQGWEDLWADLKDSPRLEYERTPFFLKLETEQYTFRGGPPRGPAELFSGFCWQALARELAKHNAVLGDLRLLTERDRQRVAGEWRRAVHRLPGEGRLFPAMTALAFGMQAQGVEERVGYGQACALLRAFAGAADGADEPPIDEALVQAGEALNLLAEDRGSEELYYVHQLFQEYFAARRLAEAPGELERLGAPWRLEDMPEPLAEKRASLPVSEPLPLLATTGWERTAEVAAALAPEEKAFVGRVAELNLPLAGRCAAQPEVVLDDAFKDALKRRLVERSRERGADPRARIDAGRALGELGDPRFERRQGPHGAYLLPPFVDIPAGRYPMGSEEGDADERPVHRVELEGYKLGRFPVTNAEWALFMAAGGYAEERWWDTEDGRLWRKGELDQSEEKQFWRDLQQELRADFEGTLARRWRNPTPQSVQGLQGFKGWDPDALEAWLDKRFPSKAVDEPAYWRSERYGHPAQPVVGVCWYEARAYCRWLGAHADLRIRLPTETQWEAACRGRAGRRYAWGEDYDAERCNGYEAHLRGPSPVGVFPDGDTPEGLADMSGNVWEWTGTLYRPDYADRGADCEDPEAPGRRVLRGGSFDGGAGELRGAYRGHNHPADRGGDNGLRVCWVSSPIS